MNATHPFFVEHFTFHASSLTMHAISLTISLLTISMPVWHFTQLNYCIKLVIDDSNYRIILIHACRKNEIHHCTTTARKSNFKIGKIAKFAKTENCALLKVHNSVYYFYGKWL